MVDSMEFIVEPIGSAGWVAVRPDYTRKSIAKLIMESEILVADLDGTTAPSPLKRMILSKSFNPKYLLNTKCWKWALSSWIQWLFGDYEIKSELGRSLVETFLRDPQELDKIIQGYTADYAEQTLYPGVLHFYNKLPAEMVKIFVTRNIKEIADPYREALGFDDALVERYDKKAAMEEILKTYSNLRRIMLIGDSPLEQQVHDFLKYKEKKQEIDFVFGINVARSYSQCHLNLNADANIGRNYFGLVRIIKQYPHSSNLSSNQKPTHQIQQTN